MTKLATVGVMGPPGQVLASEVDAGTALGLVGENTGNLMFQYSCAKNIENPMVHFQLTPSLDIERLRETIDVLLIPAANQLNPAWDLNWWGDLVERLDKPTIVVGLGAQAHVGAVESIELQPGTLRFVNAVRERAVSIGVRGEATQRLLERLGIPNVVVTGCPSNFISTAVSGDAIATSLDEVRGKTARPLRVNHLAGTLEEYTRTVERQLFSLAREHDWRVVYQTNVKLLSHVRGGQLPPEVTSYVRWEAAVVAPDLTAQEYSRRTRRRGRYYFSAPGWIDAVSGDDLSIGMRIHGAVAAIQGGSVGVCVAFDSRTLELAQTMGYPYVMADQVMGMSSLHELLANVTFDADAFDSKRKTLRESMRAVLEQHGVVTRL